MINVKSTEYNGPVIIENDKFFYFLNQKQHLNENEYKLFVEKKLKEAVRKGQPFLCSKF